ncbi:MAG TPA: permease prefix domain 1-containing protein [Clostridia bacterium]|nr:permease prefix domain 1-containing protein [Clostridia bacterium]
MEHSSGTDVYLSEVLAHVRWKKAHGMIRKELSDHIEDARLGFLARGMSDGEAQEKAVLEMGDAADVGARFDKAYRPAKNYGVWIPFALLMIAGFFLRSYVSGGVELSVFTFLVPAVFIGMCFVRFEWLVRYAWPIYGAYLALYLASFFIGLPLQGGSYLSGYLPLLFPLVYALLIYRMRGRGLIGVLLLGIAFVLQMPPALSSSRISLAALALVCLIELLYAVFSGWFSCRKWAAALLILAPTLLFITFVLFLYAPHRDPYFVSRLTAAFSAAESMYFPAHAKDILSKVPWFGTTDIPPMHNTGYFVTNFFLVWLSAKLGRIVFVIVGALFAAFFFFAFRATLKQKSTLYRLASLGITLHLLMQFLGYFLANVGIYFLFTYPLPFVSPGDTALMVNAALMGMLFSMLYNGALVDDGAEKKYPCRRIRLVKEIG